MSSFNLGAVAAACALATLCLTACSVETSAPAPAPDSGSITVSSTVEESTQASACDTVGATTLELVLVDGASTYTTVTAACDAFGISVTAPDGTYDGQVTLLDDQSSAISTTLDLPDLEVVAGTDLQVTIDFPSSSILH